MRAARLVECPIGVDVLPHFVTACGFVSAKSPGYEADDFLTAAVASEELHLERLLWRPETALLFSLHPR
jgi:hypothetical protein